MFVGIYWQQYGWVAPGETVSGLEDEYKLSGNKPKLIYVKVAATREPRLEDLLRRVRDDDRASYKRFHATDDLAEPLADDLAVLLTERFTQSGVAPVQVLRRPTLPASPTGIIGRTAEVAAIGLLLRDPSVHLVTLVGSGGIGKTRLALEVARNWASAGAEGAAWFVDLATVSDSALWAEAVADALGVRPEGSGPVLDLVTDRLQGRQDLIVLDNFEHLLPAAPELGRFLAACPDLTVLATSCSPLRLAGEREVLLAPLEMPVSRDNADTEVIGHSAAVAALRCPCRGGKAGLRSDPSQCRRGGRAVPFAGRLSAGAGAGRCPVAGPDAGCVAGPPGRQAGPSARHGPPVPLTYPTGSARSGPRSSGATACLPRPSRRCWPGFPCSLAPGPCRRRRRSGRWVAT